MLKFSLAEFIIITFCLFPIPPLATGFIAKWKGRNFWRWFGNGILLAVCGNLLFLFVFPQAQLLAGAVAGPLFVLLLTLLKPTEPLSEKPKPELGILSCPHCGAQYREDDYQQNAQIWTCSSCENSLPKKLQ